MQRGFASRSARGTVVYFVLIVCALGLDQLGTPYNSNSSPLGIIIALFGGIALLSSTTILVWAVTSRLLFAPLIAIALNLLSLVLSILITLALSYVFGPPVGSGSDGGIINLLALIFSLFGLIAILIPLISLSIGTLIHLSQYRVVRLAIPVVLLGLAGWLLTPDSHQPRVQAIVNPGVVDERVLSPTILSPRTQAFVVADVRPSEVAPTPCPTVTSTQPVATPSSARPTSASAARTAIVKVNNFEAITLLEQYLARTYNADVGLYREAPNVAPGTYWVYSDGYLAGADVSRWPTVSVARWKVLVEGAALEERWLTYGTTVAELGNGVKSDVDDPDTTVANWDLWADRVLLAAINARNQGDLKRFNELMAKADEMWNGKGMEDEFYRVTGTYQTYHVALYYYVTGNRAAREVLQGLQERDPQSNRYGGIYTEYGDDGKPFAQTDTNTETSAITLRALKAYHEIYLPTVVSSQFYQAGPQSLDEIQSGR